MSCAYDLAARLRAELRGFAVVARDCPYALYHRSLERRSGLLALLDLVGTLSSRWRVVPLLEGCVDFHQHVFVNGVGALTKLLSVDGDHVRLASLILRIVRWFQKQLKAVACIHCPCSQVSFHV